MATSGPQEIRKLASELLHDYPDGLIPPEESIGSLFPETRQRKGLRKSLLKDATLALELLERAQKSAVQLDSKIDAMLPEGGCIATPARSLLRLALLELGDCVEGRETVYASWLKQGEDFLAHAAGHDSAKRDEVLSLYRNLLFQAYWNEIQFLACQCLLACELENVEPDQAKKLVSQCAAKLQLTNPAIIDLTGRLLSGFFESRELLEASLERFLHNFIPDLKSRKKRILPLLGLYEIAIGVGSPEAITQSLLGLAHAEKNKKAEKYLKTYLLPNGRSLCRILAFQISYGLIFAGIADLEALREAFANAPDAAIKCDPALGDKFSTFTWQLAHGLWQQLDRLDDLVRQYSHHWRPERMGKMELSLLRLGLYEIINRITPPNVVINELMDIAEMFGIAEGKNLINGILDKAAKNLAHSEEGR